MKISALTGFLESVAPLAYQENYDNAGLLTGQHDWTCTGALIALDATEEVVKEAVEKKCNLVIAHHPIIFGGLKKINGSNYVERAVIRAIKNDIAIYAVHTNLDNVMKGVNGKIADMIGLGKREILLQKEGSLEKLVVFVPVEKAAALRSAIFDAGGGQIGDYSECSFNTEGTGTFKGNESSNPFAGKPGEQHQERETRVEIIFPTHLEKKIISAMIRNHPYEEVAYDILPLANAHPRLGAGMIGELAESLGEEAFLEQLKKVFGLSMIRHTALRGNDIRKVALCGGAGSFLISKALAAGADIYISSDIKYHEFFDANGGLVIADIGHFESEQFTISLLHELLTEKFPTFAILKTAVDTNPVKYYH